MKKLVRVLNDNGAKVLESLTDATHVITLDWQVPALGNNVGEKILATPTWVLNSYRYNKIFETEYYSPDPAKIFSGMIVATSQLPIGDSEIIFGAVNALGGQWRKVLIPEVTHLITSSPEGPKYLKAISDSCKTVVVTPHWFDDCLKLRKRINEGPYCFPDPPVLSPTFNPGSSHFIQSVGNESLANISIDLTVESPGLFLKGQCFYFDDGLEVTQGGLDSIMSQLKSSGANVADAFTSDVTCYVCQDRSSKYYFKSLESGLYIGTLTWVYHFLINARFDPPSHQLLFYPPPPAPAAGMQTFHVTFTNYSAGARQYLTRLIEAMGASCSPHLTPSNTHLVSASPCGPKYEKAHEWNVIVVNHLWIEDCFRSWACQAVTKSQYTHFPAGVSLDFLVGIAPYSHKDLDPSLKHAPIEHIESSQDSDLSRDITPASRSGLGQPRAPRKAASSATQALAKLMEAQNQYEHVARNKLKKLSAPPLALGGAIEANAILPPKRSLSTAPNNPPKAASSKKKVTETEKASRPRRSIVVEVTPTVKKVRVAEVVEPTKSIQVSAVSKVRILFTGYKPTNEEKKGIRSLGGAIVTSTEDCTHLISQTASRTAKFICAISRARLIVTLQWLAKSIENKAFLEETPFLLNDQAHEARFGFSLAESIRKAKEKPLLAGYEFAITPSVTPDPATLTSIIVASGGDVLSTFPLKRVISDDGRSIVGSKSKLIILACPSDLTFLKGRLHSKFANSPNSFEVYKPELVLSGSLRQSLDFPGNRLVF
ncbi:regulator of Ty1 Transposition [Entomophthora muscae]|uniref:Regulator of Ty1 Transposition n=1 Tax=Entomophthora muscae TaxID=34485 RepID=A0ACC2RQT9_9FUNG|nr:regulator of Ty1 Transposition [Entomophthora muscae]